MIAAVIRASLRNRLLVILAALAMAGRGGWAGRRGPAGPGLGGGAGGGTGPGEGGAL